MPHKLTTRDKQIVKFVEEYGFVSIGQVIKIWFNDSTYAYQIAKRRMNAIVDLGYLRQRKNKSINEVIYFIDEKYCDPSQHMMLIMEVYARLKTLDCDIIYFKREQPWLNGVRRSDAYIIYDFNSTLYSLCVEIQNTTGTNVTPASYSNAFSNKYKQICASGEPQALFKKYTNYDNISPSLLIIDTRLDFRKTQWNIEGITTFSINEEFKKIAQILI